MGNQGKGKGAWKGSAKSASSKASGQNRVSTQKARGSTKFGSSNPHMGASRSQSGQRKPK